MDRMAFMAWRERMDYSQRDAATALGVSPATINAVEAGKRPIELMMALACEALEERQRPAVVDSSAVPSSALCDRVEALEEYLGSIIEARLSALEARTKPYRPRFAPDVQALQEKEDARVSEAEIARYAADGIKVTKEDIAGIRLRLAKRAELEDAEGDDEAPPAVPINRPWNTYRPPELTPAEEAARPPKPQPSPTASLGIDTPTNKDL